MATALNKPTVLANTFCNDGNKTASIPVTATGTNACSLEEGFPTVTSTAISSGGIPPKRTDFNGVFSLLSEYCYFLQNGGTFDFSNSVSSAIGGYPQGARLNYTDTNGNTFVIESLINNNTNTPSASNIQFSDSATGTYYWKALSLRPTNEAVVIKTWKSGTSWYRLYSDGWVEMGGWASNANSWVSLYMYMADTNYLALATNRNSGAYEAVTTDRNGAARGTAAFYVGQANQSGSFQWLVMGYASI